MASSSGVEALLPNIKILVEGQKLSPNANADLIRAQVFEDIDVPSMFTLELSSWDLAKGKFTWVDDDLFEVGNEVEIQMGYASNLKTVITGEITGLEPEFTQGSSPTLLVRGHDLRHRLLRGTQTKSFVKMTDSDIASQIARAKGLNPNVKNSEVKLDYVIQHNQTDWEFLQSRANRIGYEMLIDKKTFYFQPCQNDSQKILTLKFNENLSEFYPRLTTMEQTGGVEVRGWIPKDKEEVVGKANAGKEGSKMGGKTTGPKVVETFGKSVSTIVSQPVSTKAEADQIALGQLKNTAITYIIATGTCPGTPTLKIGKVVEVKDVGKRFSGSYYVTSTEHTYSAKGGYQTLFTARRTAS